MEAVRESWSDERLDDLNRRVENGFNRVDADLRELRSEMNSRFDAMQNRFDARFDALQRTLLQLGGVLVATLIGVIATLIATQV